MGAHIQSSTRNACPWTSGVETLEPMNFWIPSPLSRSTFDFVMKKSPQIEGTFVTLEIDAPGWRCHPGALDHGCKFNEPTRSRW